MTRKVGTTRRSIYRGAEWLGCNQDTGYLGTESKNSLTAGIICERLGL